MIKNIIFDIGQVLAWFRWKEYIDDFGFSEDVKKRVANATVLSPYWDEVDRGVMSMNEIIEQCVLLDLEIEDAIRLFFKDRRDLVVEFLYAKELVKDLKEKGYGIYILSNYGEENFALVRDRFQFMKYVDGAVISYQVKKIKPEPEIYKALLDKYSLIAQECVFIDDLIKNLEGAKKFGIHTVHFVGLEETKEKLTLLLAREEKQLKSYDSIIFDLDGTLWDSTKVATKVWQEVARKHGMNTEISRDILKSLYGLPLEEIAVKLFPDIPNDMAIKIMEECVIVQCPELAKQGGGLLGLVEETLLKLQERYPLLIVSNCRGGYIEAFLEAHNMGKYFIDFECPGGTGKLKADNIKLIMQRNDLKNPIYVGDTEGDGIAAREANIPFIYARYGFGDAKNYDMVIDSFEELSLIL